MCSGWGVFPDGRKCRGCPDCKQQSKYSSKPNTMATKKRTTSKKKSTKPTAKQLAARKKFAERAKKAGKLVKSGKAKNMKAAFKKV